jgi:retron-type reverse transcriptase
MVMEPIFEVQFRPGSYGFRPGRGCKDALREVDRLIKEGQEIERVKIEIGQQRRDDAPAR